MARMALVGAIVIILIYVVCGAGSNAVFRPAILKTARRFIVNYLPARQ